MGPSESGLLRYYGGDTGNACSHFIFAVFVRPLFSLYRSLSIFHSADIARSHAAATVATHLPAACKTAKEHSRSIASFTNWATSQIDLSFSCGLASLKAS